MTSSLTLATTHRGSIPSPLTILLAIAAVGFVLWSRMKGQPLRAKRLLVLPVVLTFIGITDLSGSSAPHLTPKDIGFLVASVVVSAVLGAARGATIELYPHQGELWQRYRPNTVGLWVALIVTKVVLVGAAGAAHASSGWRDQQPPGLARRQPAGRSSGRGRGPCRPGCPSPRRARTATPTGPAGPSPHLLRPPSTPPCPRGAPPAAGRTRGRSSRPRLATTADSGGRLACVTAPTGSAGSSANPGANEQLRPPAQPPPRPP